MRCECDYPAAWGSTGAHDWRSRGPSPPPCCLPSQPTAPPQAGLLAASGVCLAFHFGLWVYSVQATSLTHSLLFVSATPLFLAGGTCLLGRPISAGELGGTAVGLAGGVLLATAAARSDAQVRGAGARARRRLGGVQVVCRSGHGAGRSGHGGPGGRESLPLTPPAPPAASVRR